MDSAFITSSYVDALFVKANEARTAFNEIQEERLSEMEDTVENQKDAIADLKSRLLTLEATLNGHLIPVRKEPVEDEEPNSTALTATPLASLESLPSSIATRKTARSTPKPKFPTPVEIAVGHMPKHKDNSSSTSVTATNNANEAKIKKPAVPKPVLDPTLLVALDRSASPAPAKLDAKRLSGVVRSPMKTEEKNLYRDEWFKNGKQGTLEQFARGQRSQLKLSGNKKRSHSASLSDLDDVSSRGLDLKSKIAQRPIKKIKKNPIQSLEFDQKRKQEEKVAEEVTKKKQFRISPEVFASDAGHLSPWKSPQSDDGKYSVMRGLASEAISPSLLNSFNPRKKK